MFLYLLTFIIYRFISYKKLKKDLFNLSVISNKISEIKVQPEIKENKTSIKKTTKKSKEKRIKQIKIILLILRSKIKMK